MCYIDSWEDRLYRVERAIDPSPQWLFDSNLPPRPLFITRSTVNLMASYSFFSFEPCYYVSSQLMHTNLLLPLVFDVSKLLNSI